MSKTIYLIRHAKSSWDFPSLRDAERPLNNRGRKDAPRMAALLAAKGIKPDKLISSPAIRAMTTSLFFAKEFNVEKNLMKIENDIYEAYPSTIMRLIQELDEEWNTVFFFGHNPTFTDVLNWFTTRPISNLPTCGIGKITANVERWEDFSPDTGKLMETHFPKDYK